MNFFEHQDAAKSRTLLLVILFGIALVCIVLTTYVAVGLVLARTGASLDVWSIQTFAMVAAGVTLLVTAASGFKIVSLSGSGVRVAEMMGGRPVNDLTENAAERVLMNIVQEMAIASGVPVPLVFVLENEKGINAFAAGHGPEDAVVAVTAGALAAFTRDELQGVIAHEFSHILNRDVRLNTRLTGIVFGILVIALTGRIIIQTLGRGRIRSSGDKGGGGVMVAIVVGLVLMAVGYVGLFFGKLIKQAVSRQREFLADASAVQFTRNPDGLASALKRIAGWSSGSQIEVANAEEISHFFFADGLKQSWLSSLLSTHPPLQERIRRLDPQFDVSSLPSEGARASANDDAQIAALSDGARVDASARSVVAAVGTTEPERFFYDEAIIAEIPDALRTAISSSLGAVATVYALLLDKRQHVGELQFDLIAERNKAMVSEVAAVAPLVARLDHFARLPLVDLAMPALRQMTVDQFVDFVDTIEMLVSSDQHLSLFEFAVQAIVTNRLAAHFGKKLDVSYRISKASFQEDAVVLLSALARIGNSGDDEVRQAFQAGLSRLGARFQSEKLVKPDAPAIAKAISRSAKVPYDFRETLVDACAHCVLSDTEVTIDEAELLRVVIVALGCPLPPFLPRLT